MLWNLYGKLDITGNESKRNTFTSNLMTISPGLTDIRQLETKKECAKLWGSSIETGVTLRLPRSSGRTQAIHNFTQIM